MKQGSKGFFFKALLAIVIAIGVFVGLKRILPDRLFSEKDSTDMTGIVVDSLAIAAISDSIKTDTVADSLSSSTDSLRTELTLEVSDYSEGIGNLSRFYEKLYNLETTGKGKIRIAYFGDSMTDGDLIVQDVREFYQSRYGGKGVGFVSITSLSASARGSVRHWHSKDWTTQTCMKNKNPKRPFGVDGQVFFAAANGSSWIKYTAGGGDNTSMLYNPVLFYGSSDRENLSVKVNIGKDSTYREPLNADKLLNTKLLGESSKEIKVTFDKIDPSMPIYGFNFDNGKGVHVDNFSLRGNSGLSLALYDKELMGALNKELNYDLLVLQYGTNVLGYGTLDYTWYETKMASVINNLRTCFPSADILIISVGDRSVKSEMVMKTDKAVAPLLKAQRRSAENGNTAFVNLQALMGGDGSMIQWTKDGLANKDYTHFSIKGARKVAGLLCNELDKGFDEYKKVR